MSYAETQDRNDEWTITIDGPDATGKTIYMVRLNGKAWTRTFSMSEARHVVRQYRLER